ncbi:MAG TPA: helix-turn-helix transcriptional regulator [Patescibacteria group bacterium]|nr:helix-turn-helix transcriptional regulator [Patescibacteria group bacterium]
MAVRGKGKRKRKSRAGYMISAVAELYRVHPQTLRLYERQGLLKPSRTQGNTRVYTDEDLERLETILTLSRDLGVNLAGIEVVLNMRDKMMEMERQMHSFVAFVREEMAREFAGTPYAQRPNAIVRFRPPKIGRVER